MRQSDLVPLGRDGQVPYLAARPHGAPAHAVLALQRLAGNRATTALLRKGRTTAEFTHSREKEGGARKGGWYRKTPRADEAQKHKPLDRDKYKADWLIKGGAGYPEAETEEVDVEDYKSLDALKEVFASNLFAALAGARFTGKARLVKGLEAPEKLNVDGQRLWSASKEVPGFMSHEKLIRTSNHPDIHGFVPGLGRILLVGLFLGETDWNSGNYGLAIRDGQVEARRIDIGTLQLHWASVDDLLTPERLISKAKGIRYRPTQVDPNEVAAAIRELLAVGEQTIEHVAKQFEADFAAGGASATLVRLRKLLLERLAALRTRSKS